MQALSKHRLSGLQWLCAYLQICKLYCKEPAPWNCCLKAREAASALCYPEANLSLPSIDLDNDFFISNKGVGCLFLFSILGCSCYLVIIASLLVLFLLTVPWPFLSFPPWACFGQTKCFDCEGRNRRELIPDLNKNWQVKSEINFLHPSCWPYESACEIGSCRLSCLISMGDFVLSVDEGRGLGEEGSPVQNQESCDCAGLRQK